MSQLQTLTWVLLDVSEFVYLPQIILQKVRKKKKISDQNRINIEVTVFIFFNQSAKNTK